MLRLIGVGDDSEVFSDDHSVYKAYTATLCDIVSYHNLQNRVANESIEVPISGNFQGQPFNIALVNTLELANHLFGIDSDIDFGGYKLRADNPIISQQNYVDGTPLNRIDYTKIFSNIRDYRTLVDYVVVAYQNIITYQRDFLHPMNIMIQGVQDQVLECMVTDIGSSIPVLLKRNK